jgi:hypothetical protein
MKHLKKFNEAQETKCQTPDVVYNIDISDEKISITLDLPKSLRLDEEEAELLETNIHNSLEIVLSKYFTNMNETPSTI